MKRAICAAVAVLVVLLAPAGPVTAVHVQSEGCALANEDRFDAQYFASSITTQFFAGEQITVTATDPTTPSTVELHVPAGTVVDMDNVPGTVAHTFATNTTTQVLWTGVPQRTLTWTVSCQAATHQEPEPEYPLSVSAAQPATESAIPRPAVLIESNASAALPVVPVGVVAVALLAQLGLWAAATRRRRLPS